MSTFLFISGSELHNGCKTGAQRRFVELIQGFSKSNKVILIAGEIQQLVMNSNIDHKKIYVGKIGEMPHSFSSLLNMIKGLKQYGEIEYDYAVSFGIFQTLAYVLCGMKRVVTLLREDTIEYQKAIYDKGLKLLSRNFYQYILETIVLLKSKVIIVQCRADYENLLNRHRVLENKLKKKMAIQINNIASWMQHKKINVVEKKDSGVTTIVFVGGFKNRRKGHEILFPAVERLIKDGVKLKLLIAGDGKLLQKEKERYASYNEFVFLGRVNNMDELYAQADLAVVPSLQDSCPNTVLEALAYGVAVYGANAGGIPDLLLDKKYLFEATIVSVYEFLRRILRKSKYIDDAREQNKIFESLNFCWEKEILEKIMNCTDERM